MKFRPILSTCAMLALCACSSPAPAPEDARDEIAQPAMSPPVAPLPSATAIEKAKAALAAEPKVRDVSYNPADTVQWHLGVTDDGSSRVGFAEYACQLLEANDALAGRTHVRVVDIAKVSQGSDFRTASLGHVICETGDIVAP